MNPWVKIYAALLAWAPKELWTGYLVCSGGRCALGVALGDAAGLAEDDEAGYTPWLKALGLSISDATKLMAENDSFCGTKVERYEHMLNWVKERRDAWTP